MIDFNINLNLKKFIYLESFSGIYFKFGLTAGLFAGSIYAYCRSYARLTGLSISTPKYVPDEPLTVK